MFALTSWGLPAANRAFYDLTYGVPVAAVSVIGVGAVTRVRRT